MSDPVLNATGATDRAATVDVSAMLRDLARAFASIARLRGISPVVNESAAPVLVSTSLEEVLPSFITVWLKLLYLLRPGVDRHASRFEVAARLVTEGEQTYLRLQITTIRFYMNPNLLLSDNPKIVRLDNTHADSSIVYVDLLLDESPQPVSIRPAPPAENIPEILKSEKLASVTQHRIKQFVQDGYHSIRCGHRPQYRMLIF